jgi:hypothetical protein
MLDMSSPKIGHSEITTCGRCCLVHQCYHAMRGTSNFQYGDVDDLLLEYRTWLYQRSTNHEYL